MEMKEYRVLRQSKDTILYWIKSSDLSILADKSNKKIFILVPLTSKHHFEFHSDWLLVDGERYETDMYWRECGNQVIECQGRIPCKLQEIVCNISMEK
jgi:hypothetical protein